MSGPEREQGGCKMRGQGQNADTAGTKRSMRFTVRHMTECDIPAAVRIEKICFSEPWTERDYRETLALPYAVYYAAEDTETSEVIGICGVRLVLDEGQISNVAVLPAYRGKHVAHAMLETLLAESRERGAENFTLEVRAGNAAAIALYRSFGFKTEGVRKHFYTNPDEDALIQWLRK